MSGELNLILTLKVAGAKLFVTPENCYGYADKNWGKDFTSPWVWLSSNNLTSKINGKKLHNNVRSKAFADGLNLK